MKIIINVDVPELGAAIAFYTAALGLTHSRTLDDDVAELTGASATLYLLQKDRGTTAVKMPPIDRDYGRHWTPVHFDLVVPDVEAAAARALAAGARRETANVHWRGSHCISFADPFGHGFCFIEFDDGGNYAD
ncbi:MAG TPA: VOC family protein [Steroidobacteraceae bacterium]|jgi:predicted enzyme related to lactoylglutathione lyase|nr:VOC family protein [Steroidobacteraceae bacterium]